MVGRGFTRHFDNVRAAGIENFEKNGGAAYIQALAVYRNWHIFVLAAAVLIFELFRRMRPFRPLRQFPGRIYFYDLPAA